MSTCNAFYGLTYELLDGMSDAMFAKDRLLAHLKERKGDWVSGEYLGRELGISRSAIWKHISSLKKEGYLIDASRKKGYLLKEVTDSLLPQEIREGLHTQIIGRNDIFHFRETDSTNTRAEHLANEGAPEGTVVIADSQTRGRGRRGRRWFSPPGTGIYASIILRPPLTPHEAPKLTLMASVAAAETLHSLTKLPIAIKWPNDLLIRGKKVAGILTEINAEVDRIHYVIIGTGMNINTSRVDFPPDLCGIATSLSIETGRTFSRPLILRTYLQQLERWYETFLKEGFSPLMNRWREFADIIGRHIRVDVIGSTYTGVVKDIDEDGFLILQDRQGTMRRIVSGDVTFTDGGNAP